MGLLEVLLVIGIVLKATGTAFLSMSYLAMFGWYFGIYFVLLAFTFC